MKTSIAALTAPLLLSAAATTSPAMATDAGDRALYSAPQTVPGILSSKQRQFYSQVLAAIRGERWADAKSMLAEAKDGPLDDFLRAEFWLAAYAYEKGDDDDLQAISAKLAETPCSPLYKGPVSPDKALQKLVKAGSQA